MDITITTAVEGWAFVSRRNGRTALCKGAISEDGCTFSFTAHVWFDSVGDAYGLVAAASPEAGGMDGMMRYLRGRAHEHGTTVEEEIAAFTGGTPCRIESR